MNLLQIKVQMFSRLRLIFLCRKQFFLLHYKNKGICLKFQYFCSEVCRQSSLLSLLSCIPTWQSTPGHGHMPLAWPVDQHRSGFAWKLTMCTDTVTQNCYDRWIKRWATSCVNWTEGRGVEGVCVSNWWNRLRTETHVFLYGCKWKCINNK